jgi:hypothetical protein
MLILLQFLSSAGSLLNLNAKRIFDSKGREIVGKNDISFQTIISAF